MKTKVYEIGDTVLCDMCNRDFTDSDEPGGFVFSSNGVCPVCAPDFEKSVIKYGEEKYIVARPKEGQSFADFVREYRRSRYGKAGDQVKITTF
jgi:hypothetical protein